MRLAPRSPPSWPGSRTSYAVTRPPPATTRRRSSDRYTLRPVTPGDHEALFALHREALGAYIVAVYGPWDEGLQRDMHRQWLDRRDPKVIEIDGEMIGVLDHTWTADQLVIDRIAIWPRHQRRGWGSAVLVDLVTEADRRRVDAALEVFDINPARSLYGRLGFIEVGRDGHKVLMRRGPLPNGGMRPDVAYRC